MRAVLWALALFLAPASGSAQESGGPDMSEWSAVDYNNFLVHDAYATLRKIAARTSAESRTGKVEAVRASLIWMNQELTAGAARIKAVPGYEGDTEMRDAMSAALLEMRDALAEIVPEVLEISHQIPATKADIKRLEELFAALDARMQKADASVRESQAAFAERTGGTLSDEAPVVGEPPPDFEAEGVPPEGVELPGQLFVAMTSRHAVGASQLTNPLVDEFNRCLAISPKEDPDAVVACAEELRAAVKGARVELKKLDSDWYGYTDSYDAASAFLDRMDGVAGDLSEYGELWAKPQKTREDATRINTLGPTLGDRVNQGIQGMQAADQAWREHFHFEAFQAFMEAQAEAAVKELEALESGNGDDPEAIPDRPAVSTPESPRSSSRSTRPAHPPAP